MHGLSPLLSSELRLVCDRRVDGDAERARPGDRICISASLASVNPERCPRRLDSLESDSLRLITGRKNIIPPSVVRSA